MNGLPGYYGQPYPVMDMQSMPMDGYTQDPNLDAVDPATMDLDIMGQPQTLHQIISQNNAQLMRRRAFEAEFPQNTRDHSRRTSMHEFGSSNMNADLANYQFDPNPNDLNASMPIPISGVPSTDMAYQQKPLDPHSGQPRGDLSLNTRFSQMNARFGDISAVSTYSPAMMSNEPSPAYMPQTVDVGMDFDAMSQNTNTIRMDPNSLSGPMYSASPIASSFPVSYLPPNSDIRAASNTHPHPPNHASTVGAVDMDPTTMSRAFAHPQAPAQIQGVVPHPVPTTSAPASTMPSPLHLQRTPARRQSLDMAPRGQAQHMNSGPSSISPAAQPMGQNLTPSLAPSKYANAYSSSGFDMLGVLMRVATRRKPEINIGPVDLSCAFVVCDIDKHDLPIVYCSEMFERLTGYTKHEILGRNCRFLQAPDGKVQPGVKRKYVDDRSILYLKNQISKRREAQLSLINYRKGGQPFMNLLTMIPIPFDSDDFKYYVGFQVDLVEQPGSVSGRNPDGSYAINYNRGSLPAYALPPTPATTQAIQEMGQTIPRDEVSHVLTSVGRGESELSRRLWDKILLENTDDVVHVLSLKGLFLYLSPACRKVLEYDANELIGMALSSVCHPSDIVPVTRELKDASSSTMVNVVYRIRRKHSGYTWFEAHGSLHTEQGKGRKCLILVGRERPVYVLDRAELASEGSLGESELWTKISTAGLFLHVSSTSRVMLDRLPEDLVGTSMQALMRPDSRPAFLNLLELARSGQKGTCKHDLQNRRGQVLHAQTTVYPGDARPGFKPTFLLAQTRLLKMTRAALLNQKPSSSTAPSPRTDHASVGSGTPATHVSGPSQLSRAHTASTTTLSTASTFTNPHPAVTNAGTYGLSIGNQDEALAAEENIFDELKTTRSTSWQFELRQMERQNRVLSEELQGLLGRKKKRKRRKGLGQLEKDCANCHTRVTPEWRRGPSGNRDLCNSCGLRWAKQNGRVSPRKNSGTSDKSSTSPVYGTQAAATKPDERVGTPSGTTDGISAQGNVPTLIKQLSNSSNGATDPWRCSLPPKIEEAPDEANVLPT